MDFDQYSKSKLAENAVINSDSSSSVKVDDNANDINTSNKKMKFDNGEKAKKKVKRPLFTPKPPEGPPPPAAFVN